MILSIDLNPILKRKYFLDDLNLSEENIPSNFIYGPGGAGIELAYLLRGLNEDVLFSGFLGGINGEFVHKILSDNGIPNDCLAIRDETSDNIIISLNNSNEITIREKKPRITRDEIGGFYQLFSKHINYTDMICCVGELPINISEEIFYDLITMGKKYDKKALLGVKGEELIYGIEAAPYLVILGKDDLEYITKLKLDYEYEIIKAGLYVLDKGVDYLVIELGTKGSIVLTQESGYRIEVPKVDITNCKVNYGYMVAGFALALKRNYDLDMMLKLAQACGMVNCFRHREIIDMSDIKKIMSEINITTFNY